MLQGKTALITGSTSGIGQAIAEALAAQGANIVFNGFGEADHIDALLNTARSHGGRALHHPADMRRPDEIAAMMDLAQAEFGGVDILVNNAGIQHVAPVDEFPLDKWNDIIAINLSSAFHTTRLAVPGMRQRGWGRIINIASAHALVASPFKSAYVAAKHGIAGFTKSCALELAQSGVTVNAICPGYVRTPLVERQIPDTMKARNLTREQVERDVLLAAQPTKRFVTVEEIAAMVGYLASDAARSVTGALMSVDGGWTAQ
ncbi:3-hydroxybutyrate dehydrogenase [Uliginosibacterium sp. sgz301328]|uniref:3-hydroxybutyrate dehydrogenase n=1 Tax=Uliginosibacterium sp. sgz301328 TaxID=3243764 RepID=UPI00359E774C